MSIKNKRFLLLLWIFIFAITALFLFDLRRPRTIKTVIDPQKPIIALTFDDGPNELYTPQVLDVLYDHQAFATFFICGQSIPGNEALLKRMVESGHQLGNHTDAHRDLTTLTSQEIIHEMEVTQQKVYQVIPGYSLDYTRPPYGRRNEQVEATLGDSLTMWDIDSGDWQNHAVQKIYDTVLDSVSDGDIIIFHDDNSATVSALAQLLPALQNRGFQFATLSQLYDARPTLK